MNPGLKVCTHCHNSLSYSSFSRSRNIFFEDGALPICKDCVALLLSAHQNDFDYFDALCRWADMPFFAQEWTKLYPINKERTFEVYAQMFSDGHYPTTSWAEVSRSYQELQAKGALRSAIPELDSETLAKLRAAWGENYTPEDLTKLERLYQGILKTQNVSGTLQSTDVRRICKLSLVLDDKIRDNAPVKDEISAYEKLVQLANLTPKNAKNANDFDSVGEVFAFLEKKGWTNRFYDGATRDIVDETMANTQNYVRNLYTNETGIADDIEKRIEGLKIAQALEESAGLVPEDQSPDTVDSGAFQDFEQEEFKEEVR